MGYQAEIGIAARIQGAAQGIQDLKKLSSASDETAASTEDLAEELDNADRKLENVSHSALQLSNKFEGLSRKTQAGARGFQGVSDVVEGSSRLLQTHGEKLGLNKEQIEKLKEKTDIFVETMQGFSMVLMGATDILEIAASVTAFFGNKHIATAQKVTAGNIEMSGSFTMLNLSMGPIVWVLMAIAAAVIFLYVAWTRNWGGIQEVFQKVYSALMPAIEAIRRILKKLGFDVEETGGLFSLFEEIMNDVVGEVLMYALPHLLRLAEAIVWIAESLEWAIDAWNTFWGEQQNKPLAPMPGTSPQTGGTIGGPSYTTQTQTTTVYGGVNVYGGEPTPDTGWNALKIQQQSRRGVG